MKFPARSLTFILLAAIACAAQDRPAQERKVYEGVVEIKHKTIGTVVMLDINGKSVGGWIRLNKFIPIDFGSVSDKGIEFGAGGNTYTIDERRGKISYSGPDGEASRYIEPLTRWTGRLDEIIDAERFSDVYIGKLDVDGRPREIRYEKPSLWKQQGPPFETFTRLDDILGKETSFWVADTDPRSGRLVVLEEPPGMDIPLKAPKKPKEPKEKEK